MPRLLHCGFAFALLLAVSGAAWGQAETIDQLARSNSSMGELEQALRDNPAGQFSCAGIAVIDLGAAYDNVLFYFEQRTRKLISACGGVCRRPTGSQASACANLCPPPEWKQADCDAQRQRHMLSRPAR